MDTNTSSPVCIVTTMNLSMRTVGDYITAVDDSELMDIIISIADELVDPLGLDYADSCRAFVDYYAVGTAIVKKARKMPSDWDGSSIMVLTPAESLQEARQYSSVESLPLERIVRTRLNFAPEAKDLADAQICRQIMKALICAI